MKSVYNNILYQKDFSKFFVSEPGKTPGRAQNYVFVVLNIFSNENYTI